MIRLGQRRQRTLARAVEVSGVGFVTGANVTVRFVPAAVDFGVAFQRTDLTAAPAIPASVDQVSGTNRRTTLGKGANQVTLVEHVLAALAGMRIDNCRVEIDGPEPPGLDGSAWEFVEAIDSAGYTIQNGFRGKWTCRQPITVERGNASLTFHPAATDQLRLSYLLDYGAGSPIVPQIHSETITPENFRRCLAPCRTFLLEAEAHELQRNGVGKHLTPAELIVFGSRGIIGNSLRFADEPARHKLLDVVGDLALVGLDLVGHVVACRSGHPLNVELAMALCRIIRERIEGAEPRRQAA